jgi:hypothetical protein
MVKKQGTDGWKDKCKIAILNIDSIFNLSCFEPEQYGSA